MSDMSNETLNEKLLGFQAILLTKLTNIDEKLDALVVRYDKDIRESEKLHKEMQDETNDLKTRIAKLEVLLGLLSGLLLFVLYLLKDILLKIIF